MTPSIRVYRADLTRFETAGCLPLLSEPERHHAASVTDPCARHEFVTNRALVRLLLSRQMNQPPEAVQIGIGTHGKPLMPEGCGVYFNVSHSSDTALVAISSTEIGIDIERIDERVDHWGVAASVFSSSEVDMLRQTSDSRRTETFFSIWTRKEAYLKAIGVGFSSDLKAISAVSPQGAIEDHSGTSSKKSWFALDLPAPNGFKAALVTGSRQCNVSIADVTARLEIRAGRSPIPGRQTG